jgi:hypothetical protein
MSNLFITLISILSRTGERRNAATDAGGSAELVVGDRLSVISRRKCGVSPEFLVSLAHGSPQR